MHLKKFAAGALVFAAGAALAQFTTPLDPDWRETDVPPPPALRTSGLIAIDAPRSELTFGIDPASVSVGADRIVRYVVVATSRSGVVNGIYEGMHCKTGEVKVYARHNPPGGWRMVNEPKWVAADEGSHRTYTWTLAKSGVCSGHTPNRNATQIVRDLRAPHDSRYSTETR
jgi:hypothetical protein